MTDTRMGRMGVVKRSAPCLLALTAMLLTLGAAGVEQGMVLCFGENGHVAIEAGGPEGCSDGLTADFRAASAIAIPISSSHCGPCVDLALRASPATERVAAERRLRPMPAVIPIAALASAVPCQRTSVSHWPSTRVTSEKPHTVVIRC